VRALRADRTAADLSRLLRYRSNAVSKWDRGSWPSLGTAVRTADRLGVDVAGELARFDPVAAAAFDPAHPERVLGWLRALAGPWSRTELARRSGLSVDQVARLLRGDSGGRLPEALALVEGATGRAAELVDRLSPGVRPPDPEPPAPTAEPIDRAPIVLDVAVSRADLARIRARERAFVEEVTAIAAGSSGEPEVVGQLIVAWLGWPT
jgi:transcriptional regulator with XRE-family HTH domain